MEGKHLIFAAFVAIVVLNVEIDGFFIGASGQFFGNVFNQTSSGNSSLAELFTSLIANHIQHHISSIETIARIAEGIVEEKARFFGNLTNLGGNVTRAFADVIGNATEAKLNITAQAAEAALNTTSNFFNVGAQAAQAIPNIASNIFGGFRG